MRDGPESSLYPPLLKEFPHSKYVKLFEVPFGRKRIDLVVVPRSDKNFLVTAIEFKVRDWKAALWQARLNASIVHRSFVALDSMFAPPDNAQACFERAGVGLILVDTESNVAECVIDPIADGRRLGYGKIGEIWSQRTIDGAKAC